MSYSLKRSIAVFFLSATMVLLFQNCGTKQFSGRVTAELSSNAGSESVPTSTPLATPPPPGGKALWEWTDNPPEFSYPLPGEYFGNGGTSNLFASRLASAPNGRVVLTSACGYFKSTDFGKTFIPLLLPSQMGVVHAVAVSNDLLFIGTDRGLYRSDDFGATFTHPIRPDSASSLLANRVSCSAVSPGTTLKITAISINGANIVLASDIGIMHSSDSGRTFALSTVSHEGFAMPAMTQINSIQQNGSEVIVGQDQMFLPSMVNVKVGNSCAQKSEWSSQAMGSLLSKDGGATFSTLPTGNVRSIFQSPAASVFLERSPSRSDWFLANSLIPNEALATVDGLAQPTPAWDGREAKIVSVGTKLFAIQWHYDTAGQIDKLIWSTDGGRSFATQIVDPLLTTNFFISAIDSDGTNLFVATNRGLYLSRDAGLTFEAKRFSSNLCVYPWWRSGGIGAGTGQTSLYKSLFEPKLFEGTNNGGGTFDEIAASPDFNGFHVMNAVGLGQTIIFGDNEGSLASWDIASPKLTVAKTNVMEFAQPKATITALNNPNLRQLNGFYLDIGSTHQLDSLGAPEVAVVASAVSVGNILVMGLGPGSHAAWGNNDFVTLANGMLQSAWSDPGSERKSIKYVEGSIFAFGAGTWVSVDGGKTFQASRNAPLSPQDVMSVGKRVYAISSLAYVSDDGGLTFSVLQGNLN